MIDCLRDCPTSRRRGHIVPDDRHQAVSSVIPLQRSTSKSEQAVTADQASSVSAFVSRQPSYLSAVNRGDEIRFRDANPKTKSVPQYRSGHDVRLERGGMYAISENEEYQQQSSCSGQSAAHQQCSAPDSRVLENRRSKVDTNKVEMRGVGRARTGCQSDLWEWCKETATDGGAADIAAYIRRDDVRKVLELRGQKMTAPSTRQRRSAQFDRGASGLQQGSAVDRGSSAVRHGSIAVQKDSSQGSGKLHPGLVGSQPGCSAVYQSTADQRHSQSNTDAVDSVSIGSQKDSGYRSEDDRHSGKDSDSPTLSASNSAVSFSSNSNFGVSNEGTKYPDVQSLCSSFESLCSVESGRSLPVTMETCLRRIPEGPHSVTSQDPSTSTRLRSQAEKFFTRSRAMAVSGHRQPVHSNNAAAALNSKHGVGSTSTHQGSKLPSSSHQESKLPTRPVSGTQFSDSVSGRIPSRSDVNVRHAESMPAINRLSAGDVPVKFFEGQQQRTSSGNMVVAPAEQLVLHHREADQSKASSQRVLGRGHFRATGAVVPSLRQPSPARSDCRQVLRHSALPTTKFL